MYWLRTYLAIAVAFFLFATAIGITAMMIVSSLVYCVIGAILVVETMKRTGFTIEDYSKRHHGGYLGKKARFLTNIK